MADSPKRLLSSTRRPQPTIIHDTKALRRALIWLFCWVAPALIFVCRKKSIVVGTADGAVHLQIFENNSVRLKVAGCNTSA